MGDPVLGERELLKHLSEGISMLDLEHGNIALAEVWGRDPQRKNQGPADQLGSGSTKASCDKHLSSSNLGDGGTGKNLRLILIECCLEKLASDIRSGSSLLFPRGASSPLPCPIALLCPLDLASLEGL